MMTKIYGESEALSLFQVGECDPFILQRCFVKYMILVLVPQEQLVSGKTSPTLSFQISQRIVEDRPYSAVSFCLFSC